MKPPAETNLKAGGGLNAPAGSSNGDRPVTISSARASPSTGAIVNPAAPYPVAT